MSVLHQQRIRVSYNPQGFLAPEKPWETVCPCCSVTAFGSGVSHDAFATWTEALAMAENHLRRYHCRYCIDTQMPAGRCDYMGELYQRCPLCQPACKSCDGLAAYPASYNTPSELRADLQALGLGPIFCLDCNGVISLIPLDPEAIS
ncbi:hypothetical protein [Actinoplanes sp. NBRC 103695]|uniref:hypothetical protein n=1 Tax=Actinoplanes sp. NBRC 103695 TaxID=3032202 RepID=UPI0024A4A7A0|nr:hypothetical protein [Actinoplanes sp. NBRC 103695]GLZ00580.1 hypothetical protein Acsp02_78320 [Actinoplanes sp. NBRC 103695]